MVHNGRLLSTVNKLFLTTAVNVIFVLGPLDGLSVPVAPEENCPSIEEDFTSGSQDDHLETSA